MMEAYLAAVDCWPTLPVEFSSRQAEMLKSHTPVIAVDACPVLVLAMVVATG